MTGAFPKDNYGVRKKIVYRCARKSTNAGSKIYCTTIHQVREEVIEKYLLENIKEQAENHIIEINKIKAESAKVNVDVNKIKNKLTKLKDLYLNDMIQIEDYKKEYGFLTAQLESAETKKIKKTQLDLKPFTDILNGFLDNRYSGLTREQKRFFWCQIIEYIEVDKQKNMKVYFRR